MANDGTNNFQIPPDMRVFAEKSVEQANAKPAVVFPLPALPQIKVRSLSGMKPSINQSMPLISDRSSDSGCVTALL